jgi:hypothetical protein
MIWIIRILRRQHLADCIEVRRFRQLPTNGIAFTLTEIGVSEEDMAAHADPLDFHAKQQRCVSHTSLVKLNAHSQVIRRIALRQVLHQKLPIGICICPPLELSHHVRP